MQRIGIFGGTFDPVHVGHLVAALWCRDELALDNVLLVVANEPWQKVATRDLSSAEDRFAVVAAAVEGVERLEASRIEIDRGGPSYTADTVEQVSGEFPGAALYLVVGTDVAAELGTWQRIEEVSSLVTLVVVDRTLPQDNSARGPGRSEGRGSEGRGSELLARRETVEWRWPGAVERVRMPMLEVSSSELRDHIQRGRSVEFLIPEPAIRLIERLGLYSVGG